MRSERREAIQALLEFLLSRLELASLCVGTPTLKDGFIDLDRSLADFMRRKLDLFKPLFRPKPVQETGMDMKEAQRLVNAKMNFPPDWSPGQGSPEGV